MKKVLCCLLACIVLSASSAFSEDYFGPVYAKNDRGEAIVDDVSFDAYEPTDDNARVFYEIFVGSFSDSDGDGTGDLRGIINRLDYLNDGDPQSGLSLGVEGLWLTPIFLSPSYHKYDVTDFYAVDPAFGTMDDLTELLEKCHQRGIKVILDLPINHTSTEHRMFKSFLNAHLMQNTESGAYDFYHWLPEDAAAPAGQTYVKNARSHVKYEANFSDTMPEPDFDQAAVRQYMLDVAKYYLALGVDGFRFDAAKYVYFGDNEKSAAFWDWYLTELRAVKPDMYTVAEVWDGDGVIDKYVPMTNCFNFTASGVNGILADTAKAGDANRFCAYVQRTQEHAAALRGDAMNVFFISNHDMDRAAGYLTVASGRMKMAANLYLLSPGSPFIYYGEEIGMLGSRGGANTDANRRLAMLWGDGDAVRDPAGSTYDAAKQTPYSVQDQLSMNSSLLNHYKKLLMIRKANPEIARGVCTALNFADTKLGGFVCSWQGKDVMVLHNPTGRDITVDISAVWDHAFTQISAFAGAGRAFLSESQLTLEAQTSVVLR